MRKSFSNYNITVFFTILYLCKNFDTLVKTFSSNPFHALNISISLNNKLRYLLCKYGIPIYNSTVQFIQKNLFHILAFQFICAYHIQLDSEF